MTYRDITVHSSVSRSAETSVVVDSRLVLAHGPLGAGVVAAVGLFLLAVETGVALRALAAVALRQVEAGAAVVARLGGALVDVNFAAATRESSRAEALNVVAHGHTEAAVLAGVFGASRQRAFLSAGGSGALGLHVGRALEAAHLASLGLVEVAWAGGAWSKTGVGVGARSTLSCVTEVGFFGQWLIQNQIFGAGQLYQIIYTHKSKQKIFLEAIIINYFIKINCY